MAITVDARRLREPEAQSDAVSALQAQLLNARNLDGGWPYYPGKSSRLEPTCWALLGLAGHPACGPALEALLRWPTPDNLLVEGPSGQVNFAFNGLAAIALAAADTDGQRMSERVLGALLRVKGRKGRNHKVLGQDSTLQGWPWIDQTFSWVEPTSWCLLAFKRVRHSMGGSAKAEDRMDEAERLLADRACQGGGWNYGSRRIFDKDLAAHVPTTALALLAMQDRMAHPAVRLGVQYLGKQRFSEPSTAALSLVSLALRVCGVDVADVNERLLAHLQTASDIRNLASLAMAVCALRGDAVDAPFRV